jgi:urease accessory protein UreH
VAHGESYGFRQFEGSLTVVGRAQKPVFHEAYCLAPRTDSMHELGVLGRAGVEALATFLVVTDPDRTPALFAELRGTFAADDGRNVGVGTLRDNRGVVVKALASDAREARLLMHSAWYAVRRSLFGVGLPWPWKR